MEMIKIVLYKKSFGNGEIFDQIAAAMGKERQEVLVLEVAVDANAPDVSDLMSGLPVREMAECKCEC
jgi:hypothetical protein